MKSSTKYLVCGLINMTCLMLQAQTGNQTTPGDWTNYTRISGHGLSKTNIDATIKDARETYLFGIEVDNDIPGRYESFLDPRQKLEDIKNLADKAHAINNHAFVYIAGLECITPNADTSAHSFFKDHPDWVQRDIQNRPAKFGGGEAFWITGKDEDIWISPYAMEWRKIYMKHIRDIAATGIDGIYVDIPYWMTHFNGWEKTWASFDQYTVEAFRKKTGLDAMKDLKLGDMTDAHFRKWIDFRMESLTDFMAEISQNAKSVNPDCKIIAEIYPDAGEEAVRVGSDVYDLYNVVDVIAHEYSGGGGNAANKNPLQWFDRMAGMYGFRAFAGTKASWMLSYSWTKANKVKPMGPMKNLALSNLMAGTNHYDAREQVMSGSNDFETRKVMYKWIAENDRKFYTPRDPIAPIGIYFSPSTRNYFAKDFMTSFEGMMNIMLQGHLEFQIVTPKTLKTFKGKVLVLPDVKCLSDDEADILQNDLKNDMGLIVTGETGWFNEHGDKNKDGRMSAILHLSNGIKKTKSNKSGSKFIFYPDCPGKMYSKLTKAEFDQAAWTNVYQQKNFYNYLNAFKTEVSANFDLHPEISIDAAPFVSTQVAMVEGKPTIFLANYSGLKKNEVVDQIPQKNINIHFKGSEKARVFYLPFLGEQKELKVEYKNKKVVCHLPVLEKGGVVWLEDATD